MKENKGKDVITTYIVLISIAIISISGVYLTLNINLMHPKINNPIKKPDNKVITLKNLYKNNDNDLVLHNNSTIYIGSNPNNYVLFNNDLWRIISEDISTNTPLNYYDTNLKLIKYEPIITSTIEKEFLNSNIDLELNKIYYNSLPNDIKNMIEPQIIYDNTNTYLRNISLLSLNDINNIDNYIDNKYNNWLNFNDNTIITDYNDNMKLEILNDVNNTYLLKPVITLKNNVKINNGNGTIINPYTLSIETN